MSYRALEQRIAFDAAAVVTADQTLADAQPDQAPVAVCTTCEPTGVDASSLGQLATSIADASADTSSTSAAPTSDAAVIVFIDSRVQDADVIASAIPDGAQIVILDPGSDGLSQIASALQGRENVDAIHIVAHGRPGELILGNGVVDAGTLEGVHADELGAIRAALSAEADILLYGCNVAQGNDGVAFVDSLAAATGADVAASSDDTGGAALGGDWDLELRTGLIEAELIDAPEWNGELAPLVISVSAAPTTNGLTGTGAIAVWTNAGSIGGSSIDVVAVVVSATAGTTVQFATAFGTSFYGAGRDADDLWLQVNGGSAVVEWRIYASGTNQTVLAYGDPNFRISDIDGNPSVVSPFPTLEIESVAPNVTSLTSYTLDNPTNLQAGVTGGNLTVVGTTSQNSESNSLVGFNWTNVSSWQVTYSALAGTGTRFFFHDGDGDFTFVSATTTFMLGIDLDANNSTAAGTAFQSTFTEGASGVTVVDSDIAITQHAALGSDLHAATVVLTNAQAGDQLLVGGSTAVSGTVNGLAYTISSAGGQITVSISGAATPAEYQAALLAITFENTSEYPSSVDRNITVNVLNSTFATTSNTSISTIHVVPVNDAPVSTPLSNIASDDADAVSVDVSGNFSDADASDTLTFSATGLPAGLSIDPNSGIISGTVDNSASVGGPYSVTITATDASGASTQQTFTWSVANPAPVANDDMLGVEENTSGSGDVIANDSDADGDALTVSAVNGVAGNVGAAIAGSNGGSFVIAVDGSYTFAPGSDFDDLAVGDTRTTTIAYTITDGEGGSDTATVTVTITGTNDAPVSSALGNLSNNDADAVSVDVSGSFSDADASDVLTFSATGLPAGLTIDPNSGIISGTVDNSASVGGPYSVTITATDASGASTQQTFTWSVANPAPVANDDTLGVDENASGSGDVIANDSDADGDALTVSAVNGVVGNVGANVAGSNGGSFVIAADGSYTFAPGSDFDDLAVGETRTTTIAYTLTDGEGGSDTAIVTVTITGTNDAPVSTPLSNIASDDADAVSVDVSGSFSDADATDVLTFSATGLPAGLSINPSSGIISGTVDNSASVGGPYSVTITATDASGASTQQTFTWSIANPAPVANDDTLGVDENTSGSGDVIANDSDADGDTLTVSAVNGVAGNVGANVAGSNGGSFVIATDGSYTFAPGSDFDDLAVGETRTTTIAYTLTDGEGGSDTAVVTVTITGTNDAPVSTPLSNIASDDADAVSVDVSGSFSDADASDVLTFSATGLPAGLSINPSSGIISGTVDNSASVSGPYSVTITATDASGASTQQTFTWSIANPAPVANDDTLGVDENTSGSGDVISNDSDADGDALTVSAVNGVAVNVGNAVAGSNGGSFNIAADGSYSFAPGSDFDDLAVGETRTTTITYTITDGEGGSDTAVVTVTITGTNDAPVSAALGNLSNNDADAVSVDVSGNFSDADASDVLTFSATGLPAGLSINPSSGIISGTVDNSASVGGPYSVTITATDASGASTQQTFTWSIANPAPVANDDTLGVDENTSGSGDVIANDSDADGDTLTVSAVNGVAGNVGANVAGSNGGSFVIATDGSYTFAPGSDFDDLAVGETRTTTIAYTLTDGEGGSDTAVVTVTITGTNDAPVSTPLSNIASDDADAVSVDVSGSFSDADASDVLTFSATGLPAGLSINPSSGIISGTVDNSASVSGPYSVTITATDASGASTQQTFTWSIANPAPVANDDTLGVDENTSGSGDVISNDSDADGDALTVSAVNGVAVNVGNAVAGSNGGSFNIAADGSYSFAPGSDFDDLAVGETRTTTITYTITDGEGGSDTATVTVTITGTNDAPVSTPLSNIASDDADAVSVDVSGNFSDADASDTLTFSATGLPAGLTIDPNSGIISGTVDNSASVGGPYSVTITATDASGASTQQTFTWSVANPAPVANDDTLGVDENASGSGDVIANDSDADGDALTVSAVNGVAGNVGNAVAGSNGGSFNIAADGSYSFAPGSDFDDLAVGETRTTTIAYTITDGEGGSDTAIVTVTITGTNDAPVSSALGNLSNNDADAVSVDVSGSFSDADASDVLTFSATGLPAGLSIDPNSGIISGSIDNSASVGGPYSVTITATDASGASTQQTFTWSVANPAPVANDDTLGVDENTSGSGDVIANDSDADGDALTVSAVNGVAGNVGANVAGSNGGSFVIAADGSYTFAPGSDFDDLAVGETRTTTIAYTITDGEGGSDTATVTVTITGTNDAPVSSALGNLSNNDADAVSVDVSGSFSDADASDTLTFSATGLPAGLSINPSSGIISGTVDNSASVGGPYTVTITATDASGASTQQTFTWSVANPAPVANDDTLGVDENASGSGDVIANDSDADGDTLTVSAVNGVAGNVGNAVAGSNGGSFVIAADGSYTFAPGSDFDDLAVGETRTTTITYTITDGEGGSDTAVVTVTITGTNDAPVSTPLSNIASDDADAVSVDVSGNFSDADASDVLTFSATGLPAGLSINPSSGVISGSIDNSASVGGPYSVTITATDASGATTQQTFTWSVANPAPVANDDTLGVDENASGSGDVIANDSDADGDTLTVSAVNGVAGNVGNAVAGSNGGSFTIAADGSYSFAPGSDFDDLAVGETRTTTIAYTITDGEGGSDTAVVTVTITGTNDAPVSTPLSNIASDDADAVSVDVSGSFSDADASDVLTFSATGLPAGLSINPSSGVISGSIDNSASVGGPYSVTITATDASGASTQQTFTWSVANPAPVANDDTLGVDENTSGSGDVIANDSDADGDTLTVSAVNGVAGNVGNAVAGSNGGSFVIAADGSYTFAPGSDFDDLAVGETRTTTIVYTLTDGEGGSDTATVTVTITGTNDAPVAGVPDSGDTRVTTPEDTPISGHVNASDVDGDALIYAGPTAGPAHGAVVVNADGSYVYTPAANFHGADQFTIVATDPSGASVTLTVDVEVTPVNDAPVAVDDLFTVAEDGIVVIDLIGNDGDLDGDPLRVVEIDGHPATVGVPISLGDGSGVVTLDVSGTVTFTPAANYNGPVNFSYVVDDGHGGTATAAVSGSVVPVGDAPLAVDDTGVSDEGASVVIDVLANDTDIDGDPLRIIAATTTDGSVVINGDGTITFTPTPGFAGTAVVTYVISDGNGGQAIASVRVDTTAAPIAALPETAEVEAVAEHFAHASLEVDGIVLDTVERLGALRGRDTTDAGFEQRQGALYSVRGISNFSLRLSASDSGTIATVETFMRDRVLVVSLGLNEVVDQHQAVEWKVRRTDGRPLPEWLDFVGEDVLMGEHAVHEESIDLSITAVLEDGTTVSHAVRIQTTTGEVQPLKLGRGGSLAPRLFWEQLDTEPWLEPDGVTRLAMRLAANG